MKTLSCILFHCVLVASLYTTEYSTDRFDRLIGSASLLGGYSFFSHAGTIQNFEQIIPCGTYTTGSGQSFFSALLLEYHFRRNAAVGVEIAFSSVPATFAKSTRYSYRDSNGQLQSTRVNVPLESRVSLLSLTPRFRWMTMKTFPDAYLSFYGGMAIAFPMTTHYEQRQSFPLESPFAFSVDGRLVKERVLAQGEISSIASPVLHVKLGSEHSVKIGEDWNLIQGIHLGFSLNSFAENVVWRTTSLGFTLGVQYLVRQKREEPLPEIPLPEEQTPIVYPPVHAAVDLSYNRRCYLEVGRDLIATLPVVNAVFFDSGTSEIPQRYAQRPVSPKELAAIDDPVEYHRYILPLVANVVKTNPQATVELIGSTSGPNDEREGLALAQKRAETVAAALQRLGVPEQKITVRWQLFPPNPSNPQFSEGLAENRRVDIRIHNAFLIEYVKAQRFREFVGELLADVSVSNVMDASLSSLLKLRGTVTKSIRNVFGNQQFRFPFRKTVPEQQVIEHTIAQVSVYGESGESIAEARDTARIRLDTIPQVEVELRFDRFEAILRFEYNRSDLTEENKQLLRQMIAYLPPGSTIIVLGSTDSLGTERRNIELSQERAKNVADFIEQIAPGRFSIRPERYTGKKFPERLPEGRFLNRSIRVRIVAQNVQGK